MKVTIIIILFILGGCSSIGTYKTTDYNENFYQKISIDDIVKSPKSYHNKAIEINGYFYHSLGGTSISGKKYRKSKQSIWIDFNYFGDLLNTNNEKLFEKNRLEQFSRKKVKIKGVFTKDKTGHLNQYSGSITKITYFGD